MDAKKLSENDKYVIAEFLFSYESDVLIKSDAQAVVDMFKKHGATKYFKGEMNATSILMMIKMEIDPFDRKEIMEAYYSGNLNLKQEK